MNDLTIVLRSLRLRAFSTATTVASVAVAVALLLVLLALRDSGRKAFERGSGDMHLLVSADASPLVSVLNSVFYANPPARPLPVAVMHELAARPELQGGEVGGERLEAGYVIPTALGDSFMGFPVVATTPEVFSRFRPVAGEDWKLRNGRFFSDNFEVVVGAEVARVAQLRTGDTIYLAHGWQGGRHAGKGAAARADDHEGHDHESHDHESHDHEGHDHDHAHDHSGPAHVHREFACEVVGILAPTASPHDRALFTTLETSWILHAHDRRLRDNPDASTTAADLIDADRNVTGAYVRVPTRPGRDVSAGIAQLAGALRRDPRLVVAQPATEIQRLFVIVDQTNRLFVAMALVVMLSSAVGIMLALYNSMDQRRRQIAVLRVLGASRSRVFQLVLAESAIIGVLGALAGVVLALAGALVASGFVQRHLGLVVEPDLSPTLVLPVVGGAVVLACVAGLAPALLAYRTSVASSLRPA